MNPIRSLIISLILLLALLFAGQKLSSINNNEKQDIADIKEVEVFYIGEAPSVTLSGKIKKTQNLDIVAQTSGIVSRVNVSNGQNVYKGTNLLSIGTNYYGSSALSTQKTLAETQYNNLKNTFDLQKDIISKQRDLANENNSLSDDLRDISEQAATGTRDLISVNEVIVAELEDRLETLENTNVGGSNDDLILTTLQLKSQFLAGLNSAKSTLNTLELDEDNEAKSKISTDQKELAIKQLDLQEKALKLSLETSKLSLDLAKINESLAYPAAPFNATVVKIHVNPGAAVQPGQRLVTISGSNNETTLELEVTKEIASLASQTLVSTIEINGAKYELTPTYISTESTNNNLYTIIYQLPNDLEVSENQVVSVQVPLSYPDGIDSFVNVPIDAVHLNQDSAFIYVINNNVAQSKEVTIGNINGNFIEITSGLTDQEAIIINRDIVDGDNVMPVLEK